MRQLAALTTTLALTLGLTLPQAAQDSDSTPSPSANLAESPTAATILRLTAPAPSSVRIPRGHFIMGSTTDDILEVFTTCAHEPWGHRCRPTLFGDETPQRRVHLNAYVYDSYEVSVSQYARCVQLRRCATIPFSRGAKRFDQPTFPVSLVTWEEASQYCKFRGARLPTEAEFERAARGSRGRTYPWGEQYNSHASNHGRFGWDKTDAFDGFAELAPVGAFTAGVTAEGQFDLAGNAAEWVLDRYAPAYDANELDNPEGPQTIGNTYRVARGGSYESAAPWLRGAARHALPPETRAPTLGFRCARSAP